jgi:5,10-methylenetetrahydromethanopterin reductase
MRVSLQLIPEQPAAELLDAIGLADQMGYYACYGADEIYHKDAWLLFAAAAARTDRVRLGACAAPVFLRDPAQIAQLVATLDELSDGRAELVLGIGNLATLDQYAIEWRGTRPLARLREAHDVIRTVLDTGAIDHDGEFFHYSGVTTAARPSQKRVPIMLGAMGGPRSMELAGEIADGLHTACAYSPQALSYAVEHVSAGARRAGRAATELDIGDSVLGSIASDRDVARRAARVLAAFYIPSMPPALLERHGIAATATTAVNEAFAAGDVAAALAATPDHVADRLVVAGTPDDWLAWLENTYAPAGMNHVLVSFTDPYTLQAWAGLEVPGLPSLVEQVRLMGKHVLPYLH